MRIEVILHCVQVDRLDINMLLGTIFIDEHNLAIMPEERKVTVCDLSPGAVVQKKNMAANAVLTISTKKMIKKLFTRKKTTQTGLEKMRYHDASCQASND